MKDYFHLFCSLLISCTLPVLVLKIAIHLWWTPRKIGNHFRKQGINGPSYQLLLGNMKELASLNSIASSQSTPFSHNIVPRVLSFYHHWKKIYGSMFVVWFGATPRLTVSDPALIREIFVLKSEFFEKNESPPLLRKIEGDGLLSLKGEKWAHHRKIIQPTFHTENLKLMIPMMVKSMEEALRELSDKMSDLGKFEIDVPNWFRNIVEDVIANVTFGSSFEDGRAIFELQAQQLCHANEAYHKFFVPGYRYINQSVYLKHNGPTVCGMSSIPIHVDSHKKVYGPHLNMNSDHFYVGLMGYSRIRLMQTDVIIKELSWI